MKKTAVFLLIAILLISIVLAKSWTTTTAGATKVFYCLNATNGVRVGTAATVNCSDSSLNVDFATASATNLNPGEFTIAITGLSPDTYSCQINCVTTTAVDFTVDLSYGLENKTADAVWNEPYNEHTTLATFGETIMRYLRQILQRI